MDYFNNSWIVGSTNYRPSNAVDHATSKQHKHANRVYWRKKGNYASLIEERDADQASIHSGLAAMSKQDREKTKIKFEAAYFIAKEELPMSKYEKLLDYEELHHVDIGNAYRNSIQCGEFIDCIGSQIAEDMVKEVNNVNFYSLLWDGTTDVSVSEKETMFIKYLDTQQQETIEVKTKFLALQSIPYANADGLVDSINDAFTDIGIISLINFNVLSFCCTFFFQKIYF